MFGILSPGRRLRIKDYQQFFDRFTMLLKAFRCQGPGLLEVLLPDDALCVRKEMLLRTGRGGPKGWDSSTLDLHRKEWANAGLRWQASQPKQSDKDSSWYASLNARQRDTLAFNQFTNKKDIVRTLGVDLSQSIGRASTTVLSNGKVVCPTILPKTMFWVSADVEDSSTTISIPQSVHRPVIGIEAMMIQGFPIFERKWEPLLRDFGDIVLLQSLAGNAFPGTVVIAFSCAAIFATDWNAEGPDDWSTEVYTDKESADAAMDLFASMGSLDA